MNATTYRRLSLALDGAVEGAHMGHPDFRVGGCIFATLQHGLRTGAVTLTLDDQRRLVAEAPDVFAPEAGAWGAAGATRIQLGPATEDLVGEALTLAWQLRRARNAASGSRPPAASTPRTATAGPATSRRTGLRRRPASKRSVKRQGAKKR